MFLIFSTSFLEFWCCCVLQQFLSTYFIFMQTHTITLAVPAAPLTGNIHVEHIPILKKAEEITINNLGSRIMTIMGNSKKRTAIIIAPGHDMILSKEDIDRMEIAIREPMLHLDTLFGVKGTIRLFQATKDRASETL